MNSDVKIQELEAKVAELTGIVERLGSRAVSAAPTSEAAPGETVGPVSTRRGVLKLAGAAAVGAVAATAAKGLPAAADNGITNTNTGLPVELNYTGDAELAAFVFQTGDDYNATDAAYPAALAGWASDKGSDKVPSGVYGYTEKIGYGVVGWGNTVDGVGMLARGGKSNIRLHAQGDAGPVRTGSFATGDVVMDANGSLWVCVTGGATPVWRELAGRATTGSLHLLTTPVRVCDSRVGADPDIAPKTPLSAGTRTIDCTLNSSDVPATASGLLLNVTAAAVTPHGFLAVTPGGQGFTGTSTLNWTDAGVVVANGATVGAGAGATIDVTVGGAGSADFFVDVFGYYA